MGIDFRDSGAEGAILSDIDLLRRRAQGQVVKGESWRKLTGAWLLLAVQPNQITLTAALISQGRPCHGADNDKGPLSIQFYLGRQGWNAWEGREADGWYKGRFGDVDDMPGHCCVIIGAYHGDEWQAEHKGRGSFIVLRDPIGEGRLWDQGHVYIPFELLAAVDRIFCVEPSL